MHETAISRRLLWQICGNRTLTTDPIDFLSARHARGHKFNPCTAHHFKINDLAEVYGKKRPSRGVFATNRLSPETRRNPPLSVLARRGLWRACGKADSRVAGCAKSALGQIMEINGSILASPDPLTAAQGVAERPPSPDVGNFFLGFSPIFPIILPTSTRWGAWATKS